MENLLAEASLKNTTAKLLPKVEEGRIMLLLDPSIFKGYQFHNFKYSTGKTTHC
jgi:hypothetical protein